MRTRFPHRHEELEMEQREVFSPSVGRVLALAFGVALLLGLVTGALWIGWNLIRVHVLP
jgi:hypothetical protein